jgi:large subunit ribosomal protein L18
VSVSKRDRVRSSRRQMRVRSRVKERSSLPRVSVFRSLNHIYAQVIDDNTHNTLVSCSTLEIEQRSGDKKAHAHAVGQELAKRMREKGIEEAVFDRGRFAYHGRLKAMAEGLRESGLKI